MHFSRLLKVVFFCCFFIQSSVLKAAGQLTEVGPSGQKFVRAWRKPIIKWRYNPSGAPSGAQELVARSFDAWRDQTSSPIDIEYHGTISHSDPRKDGYSDVFFNVSFSDLGVSNSVIALTLLNSNISDPVSSSAEARISEADIIINPAFSDRWVTGTPSAASDLDLIEVLSHEIGHLFGLSHSLLLDSMMYPAKPSSTTAPSLLSLFRVPKRDLANDDRIGLERLYKPADWTDRGSIEGSVLMDDDPFVGAHVVAIKLDEDDLGYNFYPSSTDANLLVKGLSNVSAFSDEKGHFKVTGLESGRYLLMTYGTSGFMNFSYGTIHPYLAANGTSGVFPIQFFKASDCENDLALNSTTFNSAYSAASVFDIGANESFCSVEILAHNGGDKCGRMPTVKSSCGGGGGCSLKTESNLDFSAIVILIIIFCFIFSYRQIEEIRKKTLL